MNLAHFTSQDEIFVDANIFTYFALGTAEYQDACADFLTRVEQGQVHAVTSDFVLNEVFYALLVGKGSEPFGFNQNHQDQEAFDEGCYAVRCLLQSLPRFLGLPEHVTGHWVTDGQCECSRARGQFESG